ncbi:hypothetical protein H4S08_001400 [Coemansia sp. RSA 1365]|nr:hypothetical protein H4S08_001400 [Coemansia sp. RSA 1365]
MADVVIEQPPTEGSEANANSHTRSHCGCDSKHSQKDTYKPQADAPTPADRPHPSSNETEPVTAEPLTEVVVHKDHHDHGHDHDHDHDHADQGQAIQYKEAPPQFGLATHVDDIIHTEFRYVSGFKPFQFHAPGSCLEPLAGEMQAPK